MQHTASIFGCRLCAGKLGDEIEQEGGPFELAELLGSAPHIERAGARAHAIAGLEQGQRVCVEQGERRSYRRVSACPVG